MKRRIWINVLFVLCLLVSSSILTLPPSIEAATTQVDEVEVQRRSTENFPDDVIPQESVPPPTASTRDSLSTILSPEALDPPETCDVPLQGPFGQDVEIMLGPWDDERDIYGLSLSSEWHDQQSLPGSAPVSDIASVAMGTENVIATWVASAGGLYYNTWKSDTGWPTVSQYLDLSPDGTPAILSRNAYNWVVFARVGAGIKSREWNNGTLGTWQDLAGVSGNAGAASDPVVISIDPHHMAVFYRDGDGDVWFTEGATSSGSATGQSAQSADTEPATIWRSKPVNLADAEPDYQLFIPLTMRSSSGSSSASIPVVARQTVALSQTANFGVRIASDLSVASRNENHLAVFGVDAEGQLWVKEWTNHNESDWNDTAWVKLMDDVMVERPSVASRHSNHLGVAVRDATGQPYYIEWAYASGWKTPQSLLGSRSAPLTIAAPSIDSLSVFSIESQRIVHKDWNEVEGWGHWQTFADTDPKNDQTLALVTRKLDDLMLLGCRLDGTGFYKHYTSLGQALRESVVTPGVTLSGHHGDQALAWVDGKTVWVGADQMTDTWEVTALVLADGETTSLVLPDHPWMDWEMESQRSAITAGDIDLDGNDEIIIATATNVSPTLSISVLELAVNSTPIITLTSTITRVFETAGNPADIQQLGVEIGDLDGDGHPAEVVVSYQLKATPMSRAVPYFSFYEYNPATHMLAYRGNERFVTDNTLQGVWLPTGSLGNVRRNHTATLLQDDRVLVAGGHHDNGDLTKKEVSLYSPTLGTWSNTGDMNSRRTYHAASLLADGSVLVSGGKDNVGNLNTAEVYSPTTGIWAYTTSPMSVTRYRHTSTLLDDGRVLVVGGDNDSSALSSAEVYSPTTGTWSTTDSMDTPRARHTATLLLDGRVLVAGSGREGVSEASAEIYDPATDTWSATGTMNTARAFHTATLLRDGRVLVTGGSSGYNPLSSAEVYNPDSGQWSTIAPMSMARTIHSATLLPDGRVLVVGGGEDLASVEVYDPVTDTWSETASMDDGRGRHTATLLADGRVLVAGGSSLTAVLNTSELYAQSDSLDITTTIGKVYNRHDGYGQLTAEQLVVAVSHDAPGTTGSRFFDTQVYSVTLTSPDWSVDVLDTLEGDAVPASTMQPWISLATGDLDADGLEEIVCVRSDAVQVLDYDAQTGARREVSYAPAGVDNASDSNIVHAVGDVDQDGKAEIAYWTEDDRVAVLDLADATTLHQSNSIAPTEASGELLIGDLDNDAFLSDLVGCTNFTEVSVIAVLNGAPRCYYNGATEQSTLQRYAQISAGGSSSDWGTTASLGGFISVGFEQEINVPLFGTKIGEVRGSVKREVMATLGLTQATSESMTESSGYNNDAPSTLGLVVYNETDYRCFFYDVYANDSNAQTASARVMMCQPNGESIETACSLERWHTVIRDEAGASWVDVGHRTSSGARTNNVTTYPADIPVDTYLLMYRGQTPYTVEHDPTVYFDWSITQMNGGSQAFNFRFETNCTTSVGATVGSATVDAGITRGWGVDTSRSVSWSEALEMGGRIYAIKDATFVNCEYTVVPYIYHAKATTLAGVTYPYLEMDYYVPSIEGYCGTP